VIERLDIGDGRARFEETRDEHHHHLINVQTGEVIEFNSDGLEAVKQRIARELGFELLGHRLELYGVPLKGRTSTERTMSKESLKKTTASAPICGDDLSCCRPAIRRAYSELRRCGQPERYAFEAAIAVFRYYHPAAMLHQAELVVAEWVFDGVRH
jgi:hypothetical protein